MIPPEAVCLDLDETLLEDNRSYDESIARVCSELESRFPAFAFRDLFGAYRQVTEAHWLEVSQEVMTGSRDGQSVRLESWRQALVEVGCADVEVAGIALDSYGRHRRETYSMFSDAEALIGALRGRVEMAIVTNGSADTQWEKVDQLGLRDVCRVVTVSGEVGVVKPNPSIFQHTLAGLGLGPQAVWHVGDSLSSDVAGALNAGLTGVHINRAGQVRPEGMPKPHHDEISSVLELPALVGVKP